jgi:hypothetical protein
MTSNRTTILIVIAIAFAALQSVSTARAQVQATQVAGQGLPPGQVFAPSGPGGALLFGADLYIGDAVQGLRHMRPADPANPDPINTGILVFDTDQSHSLGGGGLCIPFCKVGQIAYDGNQHVYLASYDHQKGGGPGGTTPGVYRLAVPAFGEWTQFVALAPAAGLAGNQPTAVALGPDGNLYVGFLKNGSIVRITNPTVDPFNDPQKTQVVQSVGTSPDGRPVRALAFVGNDLYVATTESLAVIKNATATTCQGGCNAVAIDDGFTRTAHVGLTTDGINRLYVAVNGRGVWRYTISSGTMTVVATGGISPTTQAPATFAFVGGDTNLLLLDRLGNLWVGDDVSDGRINNQGRLWYISAGLLSEIP